MAFSVVMPALEMAQETGKLIAWRKKEGDRVIKGEPLLEIETDKAVVEVEAPPTAFSPGSKRPRETIFPSGRRSRGSSRPAKSFPPKVNRPCRPREPDRTPRCRP